MIRLLYILDLAGIAVFAASGALAAVMAGLDLLGVIIIAAVTAIGGGTLRDLLLNRHPVFWIQDSSSLIVIVCSAVFTVVWIHLLPVPLNALLVADAFGLALFAMSGARLALQAHCNAMVIVLMGTLTGVGGGIIRDILTNQVPFILRQDIYATAAIAGITAHLLLCRAKVPEHISFVLCVFVIVALRLFAFTFDLQLPTFKAYSG
ncbi:MAG: trimeric intracellular cation channel family protein [Pseudomonadota bacterium]